jgi:hypothetical protein
MAKPNYVYEKRQKELAKKKKKEEKRLQKVGVDENQSQGVQPASASDDKASTSNDTKQSSTAPFILTLCVKQ